MKTQTRIGLAAAGSMEGWKGGRLEGWGARLRSCFRSPIHPNFQSSNLPLILLTLALLAGLAPRAEAQKYWIATAPGNWNTSANWSSSSGGAGGAGAPVGGAAAIFDGGTDGTKDGNCIINVSIPVGGGTLTSISIGASYDGTITQNAGSTISAGPWTQAGGIFDGSASASAITLSGAFNLSGGTFTCGNQTILMQGNNAAKNWTRSGSGTFNAGSGTVRFHFPLGSQIYTITGSTTFNNLTFSNNSNNSTDTVTINSGDTLTVNGTLTMDGNGQNINVNTGTIEAKGNINFGATTANRNFGGTATLIVNGTVAQTLTSNSALIPALNINKSSGTLDLSGIIQTTNNWTYTPAGGTLNAGSSTVVFRGTNQTITGSQTLNSVTFSNSFNGTATHPINIAGGTTLTIAGTTTFNSHHINGGITINTGTFESQGNVNVAKASIYAGTAAFKLTGTANQTFTSSGGSGTFRFSPTIDKPSGTVTLGSNLQLNNAGQDLTWTSGGLDLSSYTLTVADQVAIDAGATTLGVTVAGAAPSNGRLTCNGAVSGIDNVTLAMNITATAPQLAGQTYTILSRPAAVFSAFESESWPGDWTGDIAYNANGNTEVRLSNILETTGTAPSIDNLPVTSVTSFGASFNGNLIDIGTAPTTVSVRWANTEAALTGIYSSYAWNEGDWGNNSFPVYSGAILTPNLDYYYTFVAASSVDTVLATPAQYLITGELTPTTTEGTCGATVGDTATITISRPATCKAGPLTVNYALSGAGTSYVSASPASGFTLAALQESQTITFTPLSPNMGAPLGVTLTMLAGRYASDGLDAAAITVATAAGASLTANTDTSIGTAMDVVEDPPNTVAYSLAGSTYTYEFWASSLNLDGKKIYYQSASIPPRSVVLQNLAALTDSGAGWIDTSTAASLIPGGAVTVQASGGITLNGVNASGYAIDSASTHATQRQEGGHVTLMTSGGVSLSVGGIRTQGRAGGRIWITDGAGGSAGNVSIAGDLNAYSFSDNRSQDGSVQVRGATVAIAGNVLTGTGSTYGEGKPITLIASGALSVGGYLSAEQSQTGSGGSGGAVILSGSTVTVSGNLNGLSINSSAKSDYGSNVGGDIQVTATAGDLTLAGGVDASHPTASQRGAVALSAPSGKITIGSLDASKFKTISLQPGASKAVHVTGAVTNFPVTESPKRITFPAGCTIGSDIYYMPAANTGIPLTGDYDIWVGGSDTGKKLMSALARLYITTQPPASTVAGEAFAPQPVVKIVDQYGVVTSGDDATTSVALTLTTGAGTLGGTATMNAVGGVADFAGKGLNIDLVGSDKVLTATATLSGQGEKTVLTSPAFTITRAAASQLVVTMQPTASTVAGVAFAQQPVVRIEDPYGNVADAGDDATRSVALTLTTGTGALGGTATMNAVGGVADFAGKGLNINLIGADKVLTATATLTGPGVVTTTTSPALTITHAAASQVAFTTQPSASTWEGLAFAQQPVVTIEDPYGNVVSAGADATKSVALSLTTGTGTLGGITSMNAVGGVADFVGKGLSIDMVGVNKELTATATLTGPGEVTATTSPFAVVVPPQTIIRFR